MWERVFDHHRRGRDGTIVTREKIVKVWSRRVALFQLKTRLPPPFHVPFLDQIFIHYMCNTDEINMMLPIVLYNVSIRTMTASSIILRVIERFSNYCASHLFHRRILCSIKCYMNAVNVTVWYYLWYWNFFWVWCNHLNELLFIKFFFSYPFWLLISNLIY